MAGRGVGTISVTVDADTSRLKATITKDGKQAGLAGKKAIEAELSRIEAEIDGNSMIREAKRLGKLAEKVLEAELHNVEVGFDGDADQLIADAKIAKERIEGDAILMDLRLDNLSEANLRRRVENLSRDRQLMVEVELEARGYHAELAGIRNQRNYTKIVAELEDRIAEAKIKELARGRTLGLDVDVTTLAASQHLELWRLKEQADSIEIPVEADTAFLTRQKAMIDQHAKKMGQSAGDSMGRGISTRLKAIVAAVVTLIEPAFVAIEGLAAAATAVIGSAFNALAGGIGALTPIVAGLGAVLAGGITGFAGFGDAMSAVNDEMANSVKSGKAFNTNTKEMQDALRGLSPAARDTAEAFAEIRPQLAIMQEGIQEQVFAGFGDTLRGLSGSVLPDLSSSLASAGQSLNTFGQQMAGALIQTDFSSIFASLKPAVDNVLSSVSLLTASMGGFFQAAAPAAKELADWMLVGANSFREFVANNPEKITDFLERGVDSLKEWGALLMAAGKALGTLFKAGQASGDGFVKSLTDIITKWDDWMKSVEGQDALRGFFEGGKSVMQALQPVLDGLKESFAILVTPDTIGRFQELGVAIGAALPVLAQLLELVGRAGLWTALGTAIAAVGDALEPVMPSMQRLADAIGDALLAAIEASVPLLEVMATILGVLADTLAPVLEGLTPVLEAIGTMPPMLLLAIAGLGAMSVAALKFGGVLPAIKLGIIAVRLALIAMLNAHPLLLAMTAAMVAVGAAVAIMTGKFGSAAAKQREMEERTAELTDALGDQVSAMKDAAAAGDGYATGLDLVNAALLESNEDGDKLRETVAELGGQFDDTAATMVAMGTDAQGTLTEMADSFLENTEQAQLLADAVNSTDDNFESLLTNDGQFRAMFEEMAEVTGKSTDELLELAATMEEFQDQTEKVDMDSMYQGLIKNEAALGDNNRAMLDNILGGRELGDLVGDELAQVFDDYTAALALNAEEGGNAAESAEEVAAAAALEAAELARAEAAADALAEATREMAREAITAGSSMPGVAAKLAELGDSLSESGEAADSLKSSFDALLSPFLDHQEAFDGMHEAAGKFAEQIEKAAAGEEGFALTLDAGTQAGRDNRAAIRDSVTSLTDYAAAAIAAGEPLDEVTANVDAMRQGLVMQMEQFGLTTSEANAYLHELGLTPGLLETLIEQPGMAEAIANGEVLNVELDEAGNPVVTNFDPDGLDDAIDDTMTYNEELNDIPDHLGTQIDVNAPDVTSEVEDTDRALDDVDNNNPRPDIDLPTIDSVNREVAALEKDLEALGAMHEKPTISLPDYASVYTQLGQLESKIKGLPDKAVTISLPGIGSRISEVDSLKRSIDNLQNKTVTVTTQNVTTGDMLGGIENFVGPGAMAGRMINFPQLLPVGERGLREAVIPLDLPLSRVDPSVRDMAELIRGGGQAAGSVTNVTNEFTIVEATDPEVTARRVANRIADEVMV